MSSDILESSSPIVKPMAGRVTLIKKRKISPDALPVVPLTTLGDGERSAKAAKVDFADGTSAKEQSLVSAAASLGDGIDGNTLAPGEAVSSAAALAAAADAKKERERPPYHGCLRQLIPEDWANALRDEQVFDSEMMDALERRYYIETEEEPKQQVFPPKQDIFNALKLCPLARVRVVLIGQDPYVGDGQAMGLAFSVKRGVSIPPSLHNIFKELAAEYNGDFAMPTHGDLSQWAEQGVLMLNATLTVRAKKPNSHADWEWQQFTDRLIEVACKRHQNLVFLLWGQYAQNKAGKIQGHYKLKTSHPSMKAVEDGFSGCGHFKECNELLLRHGNAPIEWGTRLNGAPLPRPQKEKVTMANFVRVTKRTITTSPPIADVSSAASTSVSPLKNKTD